MRGGIRAFDTVHPSHLKSHLSSGTHIVGGALRSDVKNNIVGRSREPISAGSGLLSPPSSMASAAQEQLALAVRRLAPPH